MKFLWAIPIFSLAAGSLQEDANSLLQRMQVKGHATSRLQNVLDPVQSAWNNQVTSFVTKNVQTKLDDYSEDVVINVYNNIGGSLEVYNGITGARKFFAENLFPNLIGPLDQKVSQFVNEALGPVPGNVLLVWSAATSGYAQATDTFVFDAHSKILRQNVVVSYEDPRATGAEPRPIPAEVVPTGQGPVHTGWAHHLAAFQGQQIRKLGQDYTPNAVITFYNQADHSNVTYTRRKGVRKFYRSLFANFTDTCALAAPVHLVEESPPGVFLTWSSPACGYSTGTDTVIFNRKGKIVRHNVVVNYRKP